MGVFIMSKEVWLPVVECSDYLVSNLGRVKSIERKRTYWNGKGMMTRTFPEVIVKHQKRHKYLKVCIMDTKELSLQISVHRLVAIAFIPNPHNKPQVNHINGIKTDNRVENLEWCTQAENILHASKNRLGYSGELNSQAKLKDSDIPKIRKLKDSGMTYKEIGYIFKLSRTSVSKAYRGLTYNHEKSVPS